jgi:predicted Zn finger-like uncharacterized protein
MKNMATRCVACGTIFRVVQDQLKVSEGWVRCGRCDEVFNALHGLFDLDREQPPPWKPGDGDKAPKRESAFAKTAADLDEEDRIASRFFRPQQEDVAKTPAESVDERFRTDFADAEFNMALLSEDEGGHRRPVVPEEPRTGGKIAAKKKKVSPGFVRHAEREARWRTPLARIMLSFFGIAFSIALVLQVSNHFHDTMAAQWPSLRPALATWCTFARCRIEAPRRIEDVTVESSTFALAAPNTDSFKLAIVLRNRGNLPVVMPSIDLQLTDAAGQLVARRALDPADFNIANPVMAPGSEAPLQMLLSAGNKRVSGYTVEAFYP